MDAGSLTLVIKTEGMDTAQSKMEGLTTTADYLEKAFQRVVAAIGLWKIAGVIDDVTKLTARYETLGVVMGTIGNNAGYSVQQMKTFQKGLEDTGISMLAARQSLTMMAAAQLDLTKASQLGRVAQDAAVIGNVNSSVAFETLTRSITTGMAIEAHRLGIMVNYRKAEADYAASIGKTTSQLTEQEKEAARLNEVLDQGAKRQGAYTSAMETVGKQALSMERFIENLEIVLGRVFQPAYTVIVQDLTIALQHARDWIDKNKDSINDLGSSMGSVVKQGVEFSKMLASIGGGADGASNSVSFLTRVFQGVSFLIAGATDIIRGTVGTLLQYLGGALEEVGKDLDKLTKFLHLPGAGGVSGVGKSLSNWGANVNQPLVTGNSALTTWYDDVLGDKMAVSHTPNDAAEQARIKAAADQRALEQKALAAQNAAKAMEDLAKAQAKYKEQLSQTMARHMTEGTVVSAWEREQIALMTKKLGLQKQSFDLADAMVKLPTTNKTVPTGLLAGPKQVPGDPLNFKPVEDSTTTALKAMQAASKAGQVWAIIGQTVVETSSYASDALTRWMDNLDGLGRSWKTLGDTVRSVLADMVRQMQRAIIEQKLMQPLFQAMGSPSFWQSLFGGGGSTGGGGTWFGSGYSDTTFTGAGGFTGVLPQSAGGPAAAPVIVNITHNTDSASSGVSPQNSEQLGKLIGAKVKAILIDESRSGGLLNQGAR